MIKYLFGQTAKWEWRTASWEEMEAYLLKKNSSTLPLCTDIWFFLDLYGSIDFVCVECDLCHSLHNVQEMLKAQPLKFSRLLTWNHAKQMAEFWEKPSLVASRCSWKSLKVPKHWCARCVMTLCHFARSFLQLFLKGDLFSIKIWFYVCKVK